MKNPEGRAAYDEVGQRWAGRVASQSVRQAFPVDVRVFDRHGVRLEPRAAA